MIDPLEIRARRQALGLGPDEFAAILGVGEQAVSRWENGARPPRDPAGLDADLAALEQVADELVDRLVAEVTATVSLDDGFLRVWASTKDLWQADAWCKERHVTASMHRVAAVRAARALQDGGITVHLVGGGQ